MTQQKTGPITWTSEQVRYGDLRTNVASYTVDPLTVNKAHYAPLAAVGTGADVLVWLLYTSEAQRQSLFRTELQGKNYDRHYDGHGGFTK